MSRLLQYLRALRLFLRNWPVAGPSAPEWTEMDAASLASWLKTEAGEKLVRSIHWHEQHVNASAVKQASRLEFAAGYANGFRASCAWLLSLSAPLPQHTEEPSSDPAKRGAEYAEQFAP